MDEFFEWKKAGALKPAWKDKIAQVQRIVDDNMWVEKHLKDIEQP